MATSGFSGFSGSPASVSAVVEMVQAELDSLLERREKIRERIQNLHQVIDGLQEIGGVDTDDLRTGSAKSVSRRQTEPLANSDIAAGEHDAGEDRLCLRSSTKYAHPALKRACRIALLEGHAAASVTEIYSRIVRRGSFHFDSLQLAHLLVARTLNIMTAEGEISCFKDVTPCRWQWIYQAGEF